MSDEHIVTEIADDRLTARVSAAGSELLSLRTADGTEVLWNAGPQWPRHAPILFPCIGRSPENTVVIDGRSYPMPQHGFARDLTFTRTECGRRHVDLELRANSATRELYPFDFVLGVHHRIVDGALRSEYDVTNVGAAPMPASFGLHPAFRWPLHGNARVPSRIVFSDRETAPVRRVRDVLLLPETFESPVVGDTLELHDALFDEGALLFDRVASTGVRFDADGSPSLSLRWDGFDRFAVWSPPEQAEFVCLEPWFGLPAPVDFEGDLTTKPAQFHLAPGEHRSFGVTIAPEAPPVDLGGVAVRSNRREGGARGEVRHRNR